VVEREGVGGRGKERGKGEKKGEPSLIFTWIDATDVNTRGPALFPVIFTIAVDPEVPLLYLSM